MIQFNYETDFLLESEERLSSWIFDTIVSEGFKEYDINYIFCDDDYLYNLNVEFLKHDTLTDVISFDYSMGKTIQGDIFISIDRVKDNAVDFNVPFHDELHRVMIHGILHFCGYKDKTSSDETRMRHMENHYLEQLALIP